MLAPAPQSDWPGFLTSLVLALVRLSGLVAFAPFFSSSALPMRSRALFVGLVAWLLAPLVAALPGARPELNFETILAEVAVGLVYGLSLALLNEILTFAGQLIGMQMSFSLVNLLDPTTNIQTPLLGQAFQMFGTLVVIAAGLDRVLLRSLIRSYSVVPLGGLHFGQAGAMALVRAASGVFLAATELAAPVMAATLLVDVAISLLGKLSPQLPVMSLSVPVKSITGFGLLAGAMALWPRFIEARFSGLLDMAEHLLAQPAGGR